MAQANTTIEVTIIPRFPQPDVCPGCGRCRQCGQGGWPYPVYPIWRAPLPTDPYYVGDPPPGTSPTITC